MQYLLNSSSFLRNPEHLLYGCGSRRLDKPFLAHGLLSGPCGSYGFYCHLDIFSITALDRVGHLEVRRGPLCPGTRYPWTPASFRRVKERLDTPMDKSGTAPAASFIENIAITNASTKKHRCR